MTFDFFARGLHTRTAVARLSLRQLAFLADLAVGRLTFLTYAVLVHGPFGMRSTVNRPRRCLGHE